MANYTITLNDVLQIPNFVLFENLPYIDYDFVKREICEHYAMREIAYETPDYFKLKLNHDLRLFCDNYNKMLRSQMIEIDPFVTDYLETYEKSDIERRQETKNRSDYFDKSFTGETAVTNTEKGESQTENTAQNIGSGKTSENNVILHETEELTKGIETKTEGYKNDNQETNIVDNEKTKDDTTETTDRTVGRTDEQTENTVTDETTNTTSNQQSTENQSGLTWTEKGNSDSHNLGVTSDTPQAMLFNIPNHYEGTGRAHDSGIPSTDANGNAYYKPFAEADINQIDADNLTIGSGDTPWYNYATGATNAIGHDNYNKEGTETYNRDGTTNQTDTTKHDNNVDRTFNEQEDTAENITKETNRTINRDYTSDKNVQDMLTYGENVDTKETDNRDRNQTENTKYTENAKEDLNKTITSQIDATQKDSSVGKSNSETSGNKLDRMNLKDNSKSNRNSVRKGRTFKSPSALLDEYRKTLTFNADNWLLGELSHLFLEIY